MTTKNSVEDRLANIERELKEIRKLYNRTLNYREQDPASSLMNARKAAEAVCRQLFIQHINATPKEVGFDFLLRQLKARGVLPLAMIAPLSTIQDYGNLAAHPRDAASTKAITPKYIQPCLEALSTLVEWFEQQQRDSGPTEAVPASDQDTSLAESTRVEDSPDAGHGGSHEGQATGVKVRDFASRIGTTPAAVLRLARDVLKKELRTPSAMLSPDQVHALEAALAAGGAERSGAVAPPVKVFELGSGDVLEFALIPAGSFLMGSPIEEEGHNDDEIQHMVRINRPLYLGRYPVTQAQYEAIIKANPSYFPGKDNPVEMVSWFDAAGFCELLAERFGKPFRLPTESEWEYACRAGSTMAFYFGNSITPEQANFDGRLGPGSAQEGLSRRTTTRVGTFEPNSWCLYDMHGNVWEWCSDWYGAYPDHQVTDPTGPPDGDIRILRGGSWFHGAADARSAQRDALDPGRRHSIYGFRVAFNETCK